MTPITRWFDKHVLAPLDRIYRRLDEDADELDPQPGPATTDARSEGRRGIGKAA